MKYHMKFLKKTYVHEPKKLTLMFALICYKTVKIVVKKSYVHE